MRLLLGIVILLSFTLQAQDRSLIALKVGDAFPDHIFTNVINYKEGKLDLREFRGKLVILDAWATTCSSCVASWSKIISLQKEFGDKIQFILINRYEDKEKVGQFLKKRKKLSGVSMDLPMVCGDPAIGELFPHNGVPSYYWIDSDGILKSFTNGSMIKSSKIADWLENGPQHMPQIGEKRVTFDVFKPFLVDGNGGTGHADKFIWSSTFSRYVPKSGLNLFISTDSISGYRISASNCDIAMMYLFAYNWRNVFPSEVVMELPQNRLRVLSKDSVKLFGIKDEELIPENRYNYQFISGKPATRAELLRSMRADLDRYLGYSVRWDTIEKYCLVLSIPDTSKLNVTPTHSKIAYLKDSEGIFEGVKIEEMIRHLEEGTYYGLGSYPIINETNYSGTLNFRVSCDCFDYKSLSTSLRKIGIRLSLERRSIPVLTIRD